MRMHTERRSSGNDEPNYYAAIKNFQQRKTYEIFFALHFMQNKMLVSCNIWAMEYPSQGKERGKTFISYEKETERKRERERATEVKNFSVNCARIYKYLFYVRFVAVKQKKRHARIKISSVWKKRSGCKCAHIFPKYYTLFISTDICCFLLSSESFSLVRNFCLQQQKSKKWQEKCSTFLISCTFDIV